MDVMEKAKNEKRLIDANELKNKMCFKCNDEYSDEPCEPDDCVFCNAINDAQTIDAVPARHGRWIDTPDEMTKYKCDNPKCGFPSFVPWNYCPNCGAKMDGGVD